MATRMQKYYDDSQNFHSRTERNKELYKEIASSEIDKFELTSNATVLSDAKKNIDIEKIKKILDTKYNEVPKRKSIRLEKEEENKLSIIEDTKEYDINAILEKAKEEKELNYEQDRLKKLRDTQYDILNHLNLDEREKEDSASSQDDLMELINTITAKELENKKRDDLDPLDILTDLKGEGEVTSPIEKDIVEEKTSDSITKEESDLLIKTAAELDKSFFTTTSSFTESDFDDFNDLKAEVNSHKMIITILVVILMIIIVIAIVFGLNHFLDLGLF